MLYYEMITGLKIMGKGMAGIFVVILLITVGVMLMNKWTRSRKKGG